MTMRPDDIGPQHTGKARTYAQCVAAARAFHALRAAGATVAETRPHEEYITPEHFDTGKMHGPQWARAITPDGPGTLLACPAPDVWRVRLDASHPKHPGYCYPLDQVAPSR